PCARLSSEIHRSFSMTVYSSRTTQIVLSIWTSSMPVTIKEIAERSGLSIPTVSQVLNNKGHRYRSETCNRVLKAVRELGYRPNSSARAMRMGRFNCVALLLSTESYRSFLPNELLRGIHDGVAE